MAFEKNTFNTRSTIEEIPELINYLSDFYSKSNLNPNDDPIKDTIAMTNESDLKTDDDIDSDDANISNTDENYQLSVEDVGNISIPTSDSQSKTMDNETIENNEGSSLTRPSTNENSSLTRPSTNEFFGNLTWSMVDVDNPDNAGIISICNELVQISSKSNYKKFPISCCILMRAAFEQTLIYHLKAINKLDSIKRKHNGKIPVLEKLITLCTKDKDNIFPDNNMKRSYLSFADSSGNKHYFDMVIHNPHLVKADFMINIAIANSGLKGFILEVLNNNYNI
ncbi:hypothetical protein SDC9_121491 [bioreactor metagenome]|uniref:Uncharacterized protein n=1 Tax=bioreactor metagenome TaxID=1076179 RepID=A0A645CC54_9ZZZZ